MKPNEEKHLADAIRAARDVQTFLWGECNGEWGLEEWKRMFRKRASKLDDIDAANPHHLIELRKRLLQNAALSIALLGIIENGMIPATSPIPSNLEKYAKS